MFDQSLSKSKDLGDVLRFLPGVVAQKRMSYRGMAELYRIKPDLLERLRSTIDPFYSPYYWHDTHMLDDFLSDFLQDQDRSQLYYCDPMLQHISICRQFLSLLDGSNTIGSWFVEFSFNSSSHFLNFDVLVLSSLVTLTITSMTIYVQPPRYFFIHRTFPTTTLP